MWIQSLFGRMYTNTDCNVPKPRSKTRFVTSVRNIDPSLFDRCGLPKFLLLSIVVLIYRYNLIYFYFFQAYVLLLIFFSPFRCLLFFLLFSLN